MAHLITGFAGVEHIKSADQGSYNAAFFGSGQSVLEIGNELQGSIISNNTVRILDGDLLMKGRHIRVEGYEDMTITTGSSGTSRIDLIVMTYEKDASTGVEAAYLEVIQGTATTGTPSEPSIVNGDILGGALKNQMPLYAIKISGVSLASLTKKFATIPTYKKLAEQYAAQFQEACDTYIGALNILDSMALINANTEPDQLAGALAVKEFYTNYSNHNHDSRYYTEAEMDIKLNAKAASNHTHDDRYYTESEMNTKLNAKSNLLDTKTVYFPAFTVENGKSATLTADIARDGYSPIGIVGVNMYSDALLLKDFYFSSTNGRVKVHNKETGMGSVTVAANTAYIQVQYIKNS